MECNLIAVCSWILYLLISVTVAEKPRWDRDVRVPAFGMSG